MSPVLPSWRRPGDGVGRDACDGVRVGRVDWVRVLNGIHNQVKGEHVGLPLFYFGCEEARYAISDGEGYGF